MVNLNPLDALDTLDSYRHLFMDARFWQPYVRQVCARHSLSCSTIRAGTPGTFPVFIVDDRASHRASHCASHPYFWESPRSPEGPYFGESPRSFALRIALRIPILGKAPVPQRVPILGTECHYFGDPAEGRQPVRNSAYVRRPGPGAAWPGSVLICGGTPDGLIGLQRSVTCSYPKR
jgi:hypothetical protein